MGTFKDRRTTFRHISLIKPRNILLYTLNENNCILKFISEVQYKFFTLSCSREYLVSTYNPSTCQKNIAVR